MGTCIQKYGCKQLASAVDALMPKMGIYEKFDVLTVIDRKFKDFGEWIYIPCNAYNID